MKILSSCMLYAVLRLIDAHMFSYSVMGPTGAGKSTVRFFTVGDTPCLDNLDSVQFIHSVTGHGSEYIGHGLKSFTSEIRTVRTTHPDDGRSVVLVDTPGFEDTHKSDEQILRMISDWLVKV